MHSSTFLVLLSAASSTLATQCFFPAGNPAPNNVPCNPNAAVSTCCSSTDECLDNGLCRVNDDPNTTEYARGACTDSSWGPECFGYCKTSHSGSPVTNGAAVFMCNSTGFTDPRGASYCCEREIDQKTGCCDADLFWLPPGAVKLPPVSSSTSPAPVPTSSSAAAVVPTETTSSVEQEASVTTVDTYTTSTVPCTTSSLSFTAPGPVGSNSTAATETATVPAAGTGGASPPSSNATVGTGVSPSAPISTGAAASLREAGVAGLMGFVALGMWTLL